MSALAPSGEQIELRFEDQRAVIVEVGGGLRSYEIEDRAILDGYGAEQLCEGGRGHPLMPWPNRTRDGRYEWDGRSLQLDLSEPDKGNAIHGLVRWRNWTARERSDASVTMTHVLNPSSGYPWKLELELRYELASDGLAVTASATNSGNLPAPFGVSFHPYLRAVGADLLNSCELTVPAATRLIADERLIPHSSEAVAGTPFDFRAPRAIGELVMDDCFTDLERDAEGLGQVTLVAPDDGARSILWFDEAYPFLMIFSGDTLAKGVRRQGLAVEPMSCAPNALQSGDGLVRLEPGASHVSRWGIRAG